MRNSLGPGHEPHLNGDNFQNGNEEDYVVTESREPTRSASQNLYGRNASPDSPGQGKELAYVIGRYFSSCSGFCYVIPTAI